MENEILIGKVKKFGGRNETNVLQTELESTSKPLITKDLKTTVDLYEEYKKESSKCTKYRFTLTVKPYCTNALFNMCTEIVKDEGSETIYQPISDNPNQEIPNINKDGVYGVYDGNNLSRRYMVSNTEYSSPEIGYTYLPGYDIFDNHTLRNLSFRPIMKGKAGSNTNIFNTLADVMRTRDGKTIEFYPRFSYGDVEENKSVGMHVYEHSNILKFIDGSSANANLMCENGWYGFVNASSIDDTEDGNLYVNTQDEQHIFSHTLNNVENCGFIDMFPDRTRYSLVPKYNEFRYRYEKNWDIFLTYPWKNFYNHNLVTNVMNFSGTENGTGKTNALATMCVSREMLSNNRKTMLFRTFTKHGLYKDDKVAVFLSKDNGETYQRLPREYTVDYLGDTNGAHEDYFFGISSKTFLNDVFYGEIENMFYEDTHTQTTNSEEASWHITQVPEKYSIKLLSVYSYEAIDPTNHVDATYDSMPEYVSSYSPQTIRVWSKEYVYEMWSDITSSYQINGNPSSQIEYGEWNTYSDEPHGYTFQYIRIKHYLFYQKNMICYRMQDKINVDNVINSTFNNCAWHIRFAKVVNGVDCTYYIRQFRKLPNFKYSSEPISEGVCKNEEKYLDFIKKNASDENGNMLSFDSETYKLAFSKTLYGDDVAQVTFLDTVDISNLTDNLGRSITEVYSTIVKRNKGYKTWYEHMSDGERLISNEETEYSRCFGSVTTGFEYLDLDSSFDKEENSRNLKGFMSSVSTICRTEGFSGVSKTVEEWDEDNTEKEITENDDVFYGDVVEYNPSQCIETVLSDACFRFNTAQREIGRDAENTDFNFTYHELLYDDFDPSDEKYGRMSPFLVTEYSQWGTSDTTGIENGIDYKQSNNVISIRKNEGYYYKPHTKMQLLTMSDNIFQDSHRTLTIKDCTPLQLNGMYIKVTTKTVHGVSNGTKLYICVNNEWIPTTVAYVIDNYRFAMNIIDKNEVNRNGCTYYNWISVCDGVKSGNMKIRVHNYDIPLYANRIGDNLFVWREIVNYDNISDNSEQKHPFSNGAFYIDSQVNLYLRRQDPIGLNGLYTGDFGDVDGKILKESYNKYKNEEEMQC